VQHNNDGDAGKAKIQSISRYLDVYKEHKKKDSKEIKAFEQMEYDQFETTEKLLKKCSHTDLQNITLEISLLFLRC
jgi:hypothetical protein